MRINYDKGGLISPLRVKSQSTSQFCQSRETGQGHVGLPS